MNDLVTIIIPVYNVADYLKRCLDSVINQSYSNIEVLLVDDCSTDGSSEICDCYAAKDKRVKVIHNNDNCGSSVARNIGLERSTGFFVAFVDSDDYLSPKMIEMLHFEIVRSDADLCVCNFNVVSDGDELKWENTIVIDKGIGRGDEILLNRLFSNEHLYWSVVWNKMFRRSIIGDSRFPVGYYSQDLFFSSSIIAKSNKVSFINSRLYNYVQRKGSVWHNENTRYFDRLVILFSLSYSFACYFGWSKITELFLLRSLFEYEYLYTGLKKGKKSLDHVILNRKRESIRLYRETWMVLRKKRGLGIRNRVHFGLCYFNIKTGQFAELVWRKMKLFLLKLEA